MENVHNPITKQPMRKKYAIIPQKINKMDRYRSVEDVNKTYDVRLLMISLRKMMICNTAKGKGITNAHIHSVTGKTVGFMAVEGFCVYTRRKFFKILASHTRNSENEIRKCMGIVNHFVNGQK